MYQCINVSNVSFLFCFFAVPQTGTGYITKKIRTKVKYSAYNTDLHTYLDDFNKLNIMKL